MPRYDENNEQEHKDDDVMWSYLDNWYGGPEPARFFFFDISGDFVANKSDEFVYSEAYTGKGFTHPQLGDFLKNMKLVRVSQITFIIFNKIHSPLNISIKMQMIPSKVLPVHGLLMNTKKKTTNLKYTAESVATGQIMQAILMNEGYNQIFSYLFTQKNCEKRDITRWTNLFKAEVDIGEGTRIGGVNNENSNDIDNIRKKLEDTDYARKMRGEVLGTA